MSDLIDRQELHKRLNERFGGDIAKGEFWNHEMVMEVIDEMPSVNAEPRTGHWKISKIPKGEIVYCSECGFGKYLNEYRKYYYCPSCGARMEEHG